MIILPLGVGDIFNHWRLTVGDIINNWRLAVGLCLQLHSLVDVVGLALFICKTEQNGLLLEALEFRRHSDIFTAPTSTRWVFARPITR